MRNAPTSSRPNPASRGRTHRERPDRDRRIRQPGARHARPAAARAWRPTKAGRDRRSTTSRRARRAASGPGRPAELRAAHLPAQSATVLAPPTSTVTGPRPSKDLRRRYARDLPPQRPLAREDLGTDGTDEDRIDRYAQRISTNRQRHASIRQTLDRTRRLAVDLPKPQPLPGVGDAARAPGPRDPSPEASLSMHDMPLTAEGSRDMSLAVAGAAVRKRPRLYLASSCARTGHARVGVHRRRGAPTE